MSPMASSALKSSALMPATLASSISSDFWPSINNRRLRCGRSLMSALDCISTRPASVFAQITGDFLVDWPGHHRAGLLRRRQSGSDLVSQFPPKDLADRRLRQLGAELHDLRALVTGEVGLAIGAHLRLGAVRVALDDAQLHRLARLRVDHAR